MNHLQATLAPSILNGWEARYSDVSAGEREMRDLPCKLDREPLIIPLDVVRSHGFEIIARRPIRVTVQREDDGVIAESATLGVYAGGMNAGEALTEFRAQVVELFRHYSALTDADMTGDGVRLRRLFVENFEAR